VPFYFGGVMYNKKKYDEQYCINNKGKRKKQKIKWYQNNKERIIIKAKQWREDNPEKAIKSAIEYNTKKYKTDLKFNLNVRTANAIKKALKNNKAGRHWEGLVGYTLNDLFKRLKKTMPEGYNWSGYLKGGLEIDHIIPKSIFDYDNPNQINFKNCWALSDLQLLTKEENRTKRNKLERPIQLLFKI